MLAVGTSVSLYLLTLNLINKDLEFINYTFFSIYGAFSSSKKTSKLFCLHCIETIL